MKYEIIGDNLQMAKIDLLPGEGIFAEAGSMVNMCGSMVVESQLKGGVFAGIKWAVIGESIFLTRFSSPRESGFVSFASTMPGNGIRNAEKFVPLLRGDRRARYSIHGKDSRRSVRGEGFILQRMTGTGTVFLHCCRDIIEMDLKPG